MLFDSPYIYPAEMINAVRQKTFNRKNQRGNNELSDDNIFIDTLTQTLTPYLQPYIEQKVKERVAEEIPKQVSFYKSHIVWMIALPIISSLIVYYGMTRKKESKEKKK